jgi:hypothetical protein
MKRAITIETALGEATFIAQATPVDDGASELTLRLLQPDLLLPPGMSVRRAQAVLLSARSSTGFQSLNFECRLATNLVGDPESGECLDAQSWEAPADIVLVGTEDGEALAGRMPELRLEGELLALIEYRRDGFNIPLSKIPPAYTVGLHYLVAENDNPEPEYPSAWIAVGMSHIELRNQEANRALQADRATRGG